jgi:hypothetical protein
MSKSLTALLLSHLFFGEVLLSKNPSGFFSSLTSLQRGSRTTSYINDIVQ